MGKILDDMTRLRAEIDRDVQMRQAAQQARTSELADLASNVSAMIGGFAADRIAQGEQDRTARADFMSNLSQQVQNLADEVGETMRQIHDERIEHAKTDAQERVDAVAGLVADMRGSLAAFREDMAAFRDEYALMTQEAARTRADFVAGIAEQVGTTLKEFSDSRVTEFAADSKARQAFMADIGRQVAAIQNEISGDLAGVRALFGGAPAPQPKARPHAAQPAKAKPAPAPKTEAKADPQPTPQAAARKAPQNKPAGTAAKASSKVDKKVGGPSDHG